MNMIIFTHIALALASLVYASYLCIRPNKAGLGVTAGMIVGTMVSGSYLALTSHSDLMQVCTSGLLYLTAVLSITAVAFRRLSANEDS